MEKVYVNPETGCWTWPGSVIRSTHAEYGVVYYHEQRRQVVVHRVVYMEMVGSIPEGMVIDHLCRNTLCCFPGHLEAVTPSLNSLRGVSPSALSRVSGMCRRGHNQWYVRPNGKRECYRCRDIREGRPDAARKAVPLEAVPLTLTNPPPHP